MNNTNYQKVLDKLILNLQDTNTVPSLLLHSCCAPCSSYCLEYLSQYFNITVFYYNPNISPVSEYKLRVEEQQRFISEFNSTALHPVKFTEGKYDPERFYSLTKGMENIPEGGERCFVCYEMRLREAAEIAKNQNFDYFTTTLSISPLKNAEKLNSIGNKLESEYGVKYLYSDFKKKNGYKRSIELSAQYKLYRQNFCGCVFSKLESEKRISNS